MTIPEIRAFRVVSREASSGHCKITSGMRASVPSGFIQAQAMRRLDEARLRRGYADWHRRYRNLQERFPGRNRDWLLRRMREGV